MELLSLLMMIRLTQLLIVLIKRYMMQKTMAEIKVLLAKKRVVKVLVYLH